MSQSSIKAARLLIVPLVLVLGMISCSMGKFTPTLQMIFHMAVGWAIFIRDVVLKAHVYWPSILTGLVSFIVLLLCVHSIFSWLAKEKVIMKDRQEGFRWKFKWSLYAVFLLILAFVAGITVISLVHQSFWLYQDISANRILE